MKKLYFLQHLYHPVCSCFAFKTFLQHLSVKKSQKFYNEILGLDIFSPSLKEKISPESLFQENHQSFLCELSARDIWWTAQGHWTKLKPAQLRWLIGSLFSILPVKHDTKCVDYMSNGFRCKILLSYFSQISTMDVSKISYR